MSNENLDPVSKKLNKIVVDNVLKLMEFNGQKRATVCDYIANNGDGVRVDRTTFSRFINHPEQTRPSLAMLHACCKSFNVTFEELCDEQYNPFKGVGSALLPAEKKGLIPDDIPGNGIFIEDPSLPFIEKYLQTYYCYYFSTVSSENKRQQPVDAILSGTFSLEADGTKCKALLSIDTKTQDDNGDPNYKIYTGKAVFCPSIQSVNCMLCNKEGEFCFMIFRYSHLNFKKQECRVAEVLSTSSTPDKRYPIVHRMILSQKELRTEDIKYIIPHLQFNSSEIAISASGLASLARVSDEYGGIVKEILNRESEPVYVLDEGDIAKIAGRSMNHDTISRFISELRTYAFVHRYNKVGRTVDATVWEILGDLGYYNR